MKIRISILSFLAAVALCAAPLRAEQSLAGLTTRVLMEVPHLPAGIVQADGARPIPVGAPGKAHCPRTSRAEAAAALAAANSIRQQRGLGPLSTNSRLQRAAEAHACDMARRGVMSHSGADRSSPMERVIRSGYRPGMTAENIAAGHFDLNRVMQAWARSPGHLANILSRGARHHGIGYAISADGKSVFWAAVYAKPR